jgi:acetate kinase
MRVCTKLNTFCCHGFRSGEIDPGMLVYLLEQRRSRTVQSLGRARVSTLAQKNSSAVVKVESSGKKAGG